MALGRRKFIKASMAGTVTLGWPGFSFKAKQPSGSIGIIGLDTSHSTAFTKALNGADQKPEFAGFRITSAYPYGSKTIKSSADRIPGYTEEVKKLGVSIVDSIEQLLSEVDYVLLETNDGRLHLEQALQVFRAGKRVFIDKPVAASLEDAIAIYSASKKYNVPVFSTSSLRYINGAKEIAEGSLGKVLGADTYSPATLEATHPDLFWYGVHGVETLFTVMGPGCSKVTRTFTDQYESVVGVWNDGRIGTFRGIRNGRSGYGGSVFGEKGITTFGTYGGYDPLLARILEFFRTGVTPVSPDETLEIFTFMAAADESKRKGGIPVETAYIYEKARKKAAKIEI
jgi:predicted dehydrogenase